MWRRLQKPEQPRPQWRLEPDWRRRRHPGEFKMAAGGAAGLREEQRYGLSCGRLGQDNTTVLHVKLTETAIRALETYQSHKQGLAEAAVNARGGRAGQGRAGSLTPPSRASWAPGRWEAGGRAAPGGGAEAAAALARLRSRCGTFRRRLGFLAFSVPVREKGNRETSEMALLPTACGGWERGRRAASG
ncbi:hypothetical protein J1605_016231 [Eschrichtius robustus]|uniref:RNA polymerase II elongation factor ELL N-terminal domain-containing protein n=1 Tax=Eschrichtius robustus TaxID=9764 RepID=A0AB34G7I3_ESCRO|nr:hypothetical protein J1605_016231 [Eschrichtius robustus]